MGITASKVISTAENENGYEEKKTNAKLDSKHDNAGKNNFTKYERDVFGSNGNYWCASFVSWVFYMAANKSKTAAKAVLLCLSMSCETIRQAFIKAKRYDKNPKVGDAIFFKGTRHAGANHIGIVIKVTSTEVTTMEGNTSSKAFDDNGGMVAKKVYKRTDSKILGYGHPKYDTTLQKGSKGEKVTVLQKNLNKVMGTKLDPDGDFGSNTEEALKAFQKKYKLTVNGKYDSATSKKMEELLKAKKSTVKVATATLKKGSKGENVRVLQANLKKALSIELATDGDFGSKTEDAVKAFQKKYKLTVNGIYNTTTANKMKAVLNG